ncbi:MAG: hypothetical protein QOF90_3553, partial [Acetobacteraceae bacterium]|nr:hypothetical protein [Acetobacteraceae bacterium]
MHTAPLASMLTAERTVISATFPFNPDRPVA